MRGCIGFREAVPPECLIGTSIAPGHDAAMTTSRALPPVRVSARVLDVRSWSPPISDAADAVVVQDAAMTPAYLRGAVLLLGNFDGIHRGHQALIAAGRAVAARLDAPLGAMSAEPHPRQFFGRADAPFRLSTPATKQRTLAGFGFDLVFMPRFDPAFASLSPEAFARLVLQDGLEAAHVVVGDDFCFGRGRAGDTRLLRQFGLRFGFGVTVVPELRGGGARFSSTLVRTAIAAGEIGAANEILGQAWTTPCAATQRGADMVLSFPEELILPPPGCYAVRPVGAGAALPVMMRPDRTAVLRRPVRPTPGPTLIEWLE